MSTLNKYISGPHPFVASVPALGADAATIEYPIFVAPHPCKLSKVSVTAQASVVAHATNRKDLNVKNKGASGAGTTVVASFDMDTPTTDDLTAFDEKVIFAPTDPASYVTLAAGDVLTLEVEDNGTSPAFPQLHVLVEVVAG